MKYVCETKTFLHQHLWNIGDVLPEGLEPNRHFREIGSGKSKKRPPALTKGDDPRATDAIEADIEKRGTKVPKSVRGNRKKVFNLWLKVKDIPVPGEDEEVEEVKKAIEPPTPLSQCSPDDIDLMGAQFIGETYDVPWRGRKKEIVLLEALEKEGK